MPGAMGVLGTLPFVAAFGKVLTYKDLQVERTERWASHEVIGAKPVLEWTGHGAARVQLAIRFDTSCGISPLVGLTALRAMAESHEPQILLIGPEYFGRFVIESVAEERKFHTNLGVCTVAEAKVTLLEHGGNTLKGQLEAVLSSF